LINVIQQPVICPSSNYEIDVRVGKTNSGPWVGGYTMALFDKGGNLLKDGGGKPIAFVSLPDNQVMTRTWGGCPRLASPSNPLPYNGKIDAQDAVKMGTKSMTFRFVKSLSDLTPISPDQDIDFSGSKEYWLYYKAP
jgi:hypothetical protein